MLQKQNLSNMQPSRTTRSSQLPNSILLTLLAGVAVTLAAEPTLGDPAKLPPASTKQGVTYAADIKPVFEKSCVKCHGGEKPKGKYSLDTLQAAIKGGESGDAAIVPGNSAKSPLVSYVSDLVEDMEMPPTDKREKYPALTKEQIGLIRAWIDQGAK